LKQNNTGANAYSQWLERKVSAGLKLKFEDIVLLKVPFANGTNSKKRPAMVINDYRED